MNGLEVAVKFRKLKLALNPRGLKMFKKEIALQAKVSAAKKNHLPLPQLQPTLAI
jgi:hypothetical protein